MLFRFTPEELQLIESIRKSSSCRLRKSSAPSYPSLPIQKSAPGLRGLTRRCLQRLQDFRETGVRNIVGSMHATKEEKYRS